MILFLDSMCYFDCSFLFGISTTRCIEWILKLMLCLFHSLEVDIYCRIGYQFLCWALIKKYCCWEFGRCFLSFLYPNLSVEVGCMNSISSFYLNSLMTTQRKIILFPLANFQYHSLSLQQMYFFSLILTLHQLWTVGFIAKSDL
jgi:hypothetical protein